MWNSGTNGHAVVDATMQSDGNFVIYGPNNVVLWYSRTNGHAGAVLQIQNDGNIVIYQAGTAI